MSNDVKRFESRSEAKEELAKMKGWPEAHVMRIWFSSQESPYENTLAYAIEVGNDKYLREDGYVR